MNTVVAAPARAGTAATIALVVALNALPVWGVLAGEWSIAALMVLFWLENVFAGLFQALRMVALPGPTVLHAMKFVTVPFFLIHYGGFAFVHGIFVFAQFDGDGMAVAAQRGFVAAALVALGAQGWQAWRAHRDYVPPAWSEEQRAAGHRDPLLARRQVIPLQRLMAEPYLRVGILHVVLVLGGLAALLLGTPLAALLMLIALKAAYEVAQSTGAIARWLAKAH